MHAGRDVKDVGLPGGRGLGADWKLRHLLSGTHLEVLVAQRAVLHHSPVTAAEGGWARDHGGTLLLGDGCHQKQKAW